MNPSENPYASPTADLTASVSADPAIREAETIRNKYISHEASLQSIGILYWLGCVMMILFLFVSVIGTFFGTSNLSREAIHLAIIGVICLPLLVLNGWLGYGFRKLDPRVRIPAGILSALGLIGFPIGTLISAYILYLIFSAKGKVVFSPEYKEIIRLTPHIKYRTSIIVWILLFILLAVILLAIGGAIISGMRMGRMAGGF